MTWQPVKIWQTRFSCLCSVSSLGVSQILLLCVWSLSYLPNSTSACRNLFDSSEMFELEWAKAKPTDLPHLSQTEFATAASTRCMYLRSCPTVNATLDRRPTEESASRLLLLCFRISPPKPWLETRTHERNMNVGKLKALSEADDSMWLGDALYKKPRRNFQQHGVMSST